MGSIRRHLFASTRVVIPAPKPQAVGTWDDYGDVVRGSLLQQPHGTRMRLAHDGRIYATAPTRQALKDAPK